MNIKVKSEGQDSYEGGLETKNLCQTLSEAFNMFQAAAKFSPKLLRKNKQDRDVKVRATFTNPYQRLDHRHIIHIHSFTQHYIIYCKLIYVFTDHIYHTHQLLFKPNPLKLSQRQLITVYSFDTADVSFFTCTETKALNDANFPNQPLSLQSHIHETFSFPTFALM